MGEQGEWLPVPQQATTPSSRGGKDAISRCEGGGPGPVSDDLALKAY